MTLASQASDALDPTFIARVDQAMRAAAVAIANEDPATANHGLRVGYSRWVLSQFSVGALAAVTLVTQGVNKDSTDVAINTAVAACWNAWAG